MVTKTTCHNPVDGLLPWHVNGTLEEEEEASVARHLEACPVCLRKRDELAEIAEALALHGMPPAVARSGRSSRLPYALAAGLLLPAVVGAYWAYLGFPTKRELAIEATTAVPHPAANALLRSTLTLDLGAGRLRGDESPPSLRPSDGADWISIRFFMPAVSGPKVEADLVDPSGRVLARQPATAVLDELGRCAYSFPRELLPGPGEYTMIVREESPSEGPREHRFPFRVEAAAPSGAR